MLISAGGTGGHIFPAIATANKIKEIHPDVEFLFVGAEGKMEMQKVPAAGYPIIGLPVMGFPRKPSLKLFKFIGALYKSMKRAQRIVRDFAPDVAAGFGGYASGPVLRVAAKRKIPFVIQEQNSYAGLTNRMLAKKANAICVAYDGMSKFFPAEKIVFTGNPVRATLFADMVERKKACIALGLDARRPVVFVTGGSLGARSVNDVVLANAKYFENNGVQLLWQCGSLYFKELTNKLGFQVSESIHLTKFVDNMDYAYAAADVVVARAGASTISELSIVGKPTILIPSPNVAEDHQTHNAKALADKGAAILLPDSEAHDELIPYIDKMLNNNDMTRQMSEKIKTLARANADTMIANEILKLVKIHGA